MLAGMIESRSLAFALTVAGGVALVVIFAVAMLIQPVPQGYLEYKCGSGSSGSAAQPVRSMTSTGPVWSEQPCSMWQSLPLPSAVLPV